MTAAPDKIAKIIAITDRLGQIVAEENDLLASRRTADMEIHRDEKARLSEAYEREMEDLKAHPSWLEGGARDDVVRLKAATRNFREILAQHKRAMLAAKTVTERMLRSIGDEVAKRQRPPSGYSKNATLTAAMGGGTGPAVSLALNQVV
jgi:hypothetical protein